MIDQCCGFSAESYYGLWGEKRWEVEKRKKRERERERERGRKVAHASPRVAQPIYVYDPVESCCAIPVPPSPICAV